MSELKDKEPLRITELILKAASFNDGLCRETAKHQDEDNDGYFGFISGAEWENARLMPVIEKLAETLEPEKINSLIDEFEKLLEIK